MIAKNIDVSRKGPMSGKKRVPSPQFVFLVFDIPFDQVKFLLQA